MPPTMDPMAALDAERPKLMAMPADKVKDPPYPPPTMVAEASALYEVAARHEPALVAVGLDPSVIKSLPQSAQALAGTQAARAMVPDAKRTSDEIRTEEDAYKVRGEMYAAGRYAVRTDAQAQSALDKINEGAGLDDLIQDLKALDLFASTYQAQMTAIGFDVAKHRKLALELAAKLEDTVARRRTGTDAERAATDLRNRAATSLYEAMSEIRAAGTYAFRNDPMVLPLFRSRYRKRHRKGKTGEDK